MVMVSSSESNCSGLCTEEGGGSTRVSAPILGTSFGIASASRTEDSLGATFLKKYCSGKPLNKYLKSMKEVKFF